MVHRDIVNREIKIGDLIVTPHLIKGTCVLLIGEVIRLNKKTVTIDTLRFSRVVSTPFGTAYNLMCDPYYEGEYRVGNPHRSIILNEETVSSLNEIQWESL